MFINPLLRQLREIQDGAPGFDQSFRDKVGGLSEADVFTRPLPELHSVAGHISHVVEWRKEWLLRFRGGRQELMHSADDWKDDDALRVMGWAGLKAAFSQSQADLVAHLAQQDDSYLETPYEDYNFHYLIEGIIHHDIYHLGQMGITLKLLRRQGLLEA